MKKQDFLLKRQITILLTLFSILFISCSDDDDDSLKGKEQYAKEISKTYQSPDLKMTLNKKEIEKRKASLETSDLSQAEITIINTIPGEDILKFTDVKLMAIEGSQPKAFAFKAESTNSDRKVTIEGKVGNGLIIDVTHEITSPIVGKWNPESYPININVVPKNENDIVDLKGFLGYNKIPVVGEKESFVQVVKELGYLGISLLLRPSLEFMTDGDMSVAWKPQLINIPAGQSPEGIVRYGVNEGMLYPAVAVGSLIELDEENISIPSLPNISSQDMLVLLKLFTSVQNGLPFILKIEDNKMYASVDKKMMSPYVPTIVNLLEPILANIDTGLPLPGLESEGFVAFLNEFGRLVDESESFELILSFNQATKSSVTPMTESQIIDAIKQIVKN